MTFQRRKAILALMLVLALWCTPTVFVKYLMPYYDPFTQNFLRYASSALFLLPWLFRQIARGESGLGRRELLRLLWPSIPNVISQTSWPLALKWLYPAFVSLFSKSSIFFSCALAFIFFHEERWLFRSRRFLIGLMLTLVGTLGLALFRPDLDKMKMNLAVLLVLLSSFMWASYSTAVKKFASDIGSRISFAVISLYTTALLLPPMLIWGDPGLVFRAPWHVNVILVVSGILCIGISHPLYFHALKELGVTVCATMLLSTPVGVLLLSHWMFGEVLTPGQAIFGIVLLLGGALTILVGGRPPPLNVAKPAET
ncbi:MAG: DMT family transporter [Verrucomicrobia bacterium]|nr:DMT family transporter [Verrucomicrobiota bacterium]